jgi:hypothetical protein
MALALLGLPVSAYIFSKFKTFGGNMQKLLLGILLVAVSAPAAQAEMVWSGGAGVRHLIRKLDDGLNSTTTLGSGETKSTSLSTNKRWEYRASLGVSNKGEEIDWGIDLRTQPSTSITTEWVSNGNNADLGIGLAQAYGRFHKNFLDTDWAVTFGRAKTILLYDNLAQTLFDNDVRFDGFGWAIKHGMFGLNLAQYVLGSTSQGTGASTSAYTYTEATQADPQTQSHFAYLFSFQPWAQFRINEEITSTLAVGYHNWSGTGAKETSGWYSNAVHGGTAGTAGDVNSVVMDNAQQWQVLSDTSLPFNLRFVAEFIHNKKSFYGDRQHIAVPVAANRDAWAVDVYWGKPKKAGDYGFGYSHGNKGIASVISTYSNGDIAADNISDFFEGKYYLADGLSFTAKAQFHREKAKLGGDGQPLTGTNAGRNQTQKRFEFVTTIQI